MQASRARAAGLIFSSAARVQNITGAFDIYTAITAQKSSHILLSGEEFGVGGHAFGSAYDSSEITGEDGAAARLELRYNTAQDSLFLQPYAFYDVGRVWDRDNAIVKDRKRSLSSAGVGLRFSLGDHFSGSFEAAQPLTREVATQRSEDPRYFFTLAAQF